MTKCVHQGTGAEKEKDVVLRGERVWIVAPGWRVVKEPVNKRCKRHQPQSHPTTLYVVCEGGSQTRSINQALKKSELARQGCASY